MAKKKHKERPAEMPFPDNPEIVPDKTPEEPELPAEPEIIPEKDPNEPGAPSEFPPGS